MIRINLLEVREERRRIAIRNLLILAGLVWGVTLASLFLWHNGLLGEIEYVRTQIRQDKAEIQRLDKVVGEVEQVKNQKQDIEKKLEIIASLERNRAQIVDLLMALSEVLPEEVWVETLKVDGRAIQADAMAVDMQTIGVLIKKLKEDPRFTDPRTDSIKSEKADRDGAEFVGFGLNITFVPPQEHDKEKS